jgi:hypothetical protein
MSLANLLAGLAAATGLVVAAPATAAESSMPAAGAATPRLDLSRLSSPYDEGQALKAAGVARTSVDRRFEDRPGSLSAGFLCGANPQTQTSGGVGALGLDRDGRFLGAQLKLGFR